MMLHVFPSFKPKKRACYFKLDFFFPRTLWNNLWIQMKSVLIRQLKTHPSTQTMIQTNLILSINASLCFLHLIFSPSVLMYSNFNLGRVHKTECTRRRISMNGKGCVQWVQGLKNLVVEMMEQAEKPHLTRVSFVKSAVLGGKMGPLPGTYWEEIESETLRNCMASHTTIKHWGGLGEKLEGLLLLCVLINRWQQSENLLSQFRKKKKRCWSESSMWILLIITAGFKPKVLLVLQGNWFSLTAFTFFPFFS